MPDVELDPELVLNALLPPLLYATTARTSLFDFKHNKASIVAMSVVLVVFTTVVVGWVTWLLLPGVAFAAALALGAVVAPPDAVAASAIGRRLGLPRRVATLLEQESLVNDAAALIALSVALSALTSSTVAAGGRRRVRLGRRRRGAGRRGGRRGARRRPAPGCGTRCWTPWSPSSPPTWPSCRRRRSHASGVLATVVTGLTLAQLSPARADGVGAGHRGDHLAHRSPSSWRTPSSC